MRIAVVFTGEPRYHAEVARRIRELIVDPLRVARHEVDVILAMWNTRLPPGTMTPRENFNLTTDPSTRHWKPDEHMIVTRMFRPVMASFFDKPKMDAAPYLAATNAGTNIWGMYCQHHSWMIAGKLVRCCERLYGKYDCIIRLRLDLNFHHPIALPEPMDAIYVPRIEGHTSKPFNLHADCNDQMALGPRKLMYRYLRLVHSYARLSTAGFAMTPERVVHFYLHQIVGCGFRTFPLRYNIHR